MSIQSMLAEARKIAKSLPEPAPSPIAWRLSVAASLYGPTQPAYLRLEAAPGDPDRIGEYRLDWLLAPPSVFGGSGVDATAVFRRFMDDDSPFSLRRVAVDRHDPAPTGRLVIPCVDVRHGDVNPASGPIWIPLQGFGEELLIYGQRPPESLEEALWLAGQDDGLYMTLVEAEDGDDDERATLANTEGQAMTLAEFLGADDMVRLAIRSEDGLVSTRAFGEVWKAVGTIEKG